MNVPINFAYAIFDKNFEIQSCNFDHNFELYDCKFNYRFIIIHDKFNRIFDVSWSHFNAGILFIRKNEFLSSVKLYGISSKSEIIIEECLFSDEADFSNSEFHKRVLIKNCTFKKGIKFNRVNFNNDFSFINNEVCGCLSFEDSAFKGRVRLFHIKGIIDEINFNSSVVRGFLELNGLTSRLILPEKSSIKLKNVFVEPDGYLMMRNISVQ